MASDFAFLGRQLIESLFVGDLEYVVVLQYSSVGNNRQMLLWRGQEGGWSRGVQVPAARSCRFNMGSTADTAKRIQTDRPTEGFRPKSSQERNTVGEACGCPRMAESPRLGRLGEVGGQSGRENDSQVGEFVILCFGLDLVRLLVIGQGWSSED